MSDVTEEIIGVYSRQTGVLIEKVTLLEAMRRIQAINGCNPRFADDAEWFKAHFQTRELQRGQSVSTPQRLFVLIPEIQPKEQTP